jgi:hypothetical protein
VSHSINLKPRPSRRPGLFFEALMSAAFKTESPGAACWPGAPGGHSQDSHAESAACRDYLERAKTVLTRLPRHDSEMAVASGRIVGDLNPQNRRGGGPALSSANALWLDQARRF